MKKLILLTFLGFAHLSSQACLTCNQTLQENIYQNSFYPNLLIMLSSFLILAIIVGILVGITNRRHNEIVAGNPEFKFLTPVPMITASMVLGMGLGGFFDGILFHQILQFHEMVSYQVPPTSLDSQNLNMFWDGIFHFFCLLVVLIGVLLQWRLHFRNDVSHSGKLLGGGLLLGWGLFNIVEGVINHHLLKLHNVNEFADNPSAWNLGFLVISLLLIIIGYAMVRTRGHYRSTQTIKL
ncbi:MAG TPA: DUF2243 domain-containing protein [Bacteroidia bacterium]|jgi:uncharacterized membrane protein